MMAALHELRQRPQWVAWRYIEREGKRTKPPVNPITGEMASSTDPATWCGYEQALNAARRFGSEGGVGFVVTSADEYVGIDLDECITDGVISDWARAIVTRLNSYTEITPSGRGLRVWVRGKLPPGGRRVGKIEMYDSGRYFTFSGRRLDGAPETIEDRGAELLALHAELFPARDFGDFGDISGGSSSEKWAAPSPRVAEPLDCSDAELVERARRAANGAKFSRLWEGDTSDYGDDESAADLALCNELRFWTGDRARADRLFRQSGLYRAKWDERRGDRTYGEITLDKAFAGGDVYDPKRSQLVPDGRGFEDFEDISGWSSPEKWAPPIPFRDFDLPPFPLDALPPALRRYVEAEAEAIQVPAELVITYALSSIAVAMAKKVEVCPKPGWWEPVNIWLLCVTKPGTRSSQVKRDVAAPIVEFERREAEARAPSIAKKSASYEVKKKRLAWLTEKAAKCEDGAKQKGYEDEAEALAAELEGERPPAKPRLLASDVTPERLASLMAEHGGKMAILSPEGGVFGMMAGRYSKDGEPNLDVYLNGHAGDDILVDRGGRSERVYKPALTLGVRVQPCVIHELARKPGFRGKGLLGRWGYLLPRDTLGERKSNPPCVPPAVAQEHAKTLTRLLAIPEAPEKNGVPLAREMKFSRAAREVLLEFADEIEPKLGEWGELGAMTDWGGKLLGLVVRIAGLLHAWLYAEDHPDTPGELLEPWGCEIAAATVRAAIRIGRYLIPHARAAFAQMAADPVVENARHILGWALRQEGDEFTKRDLWQTMRRCTDRFKSVEDLTPGLLLLMDHGYIRPAPEEGRRGPGRPSAVFQVNPLAKYPQNPQNPGPQARGCNEGDCDQEWEEGEVRPAGTRLR